MILLFKVICRFQGISIKIPKAFFIEIDKNISKMCMEPQKTPNNKSNLEKEEPTWYITLSNIKFYHKAIVIKMA